MLKSYADLREIDVLPYCQDRDGIKYLNWAKCVDLLYANGANKVYWLPVPNPKTGGSLYYTDIEFIDKYNGKNRCYETLIEVHIDENTYYMQTPVMNGVNPVKDNSMSQQRVWNSMCRAFVKCVAINTGLGFNLWLKEEMNPMQNTGPATETQKNMIRKLCERHKIDKDILYASNNITEEEVTGVQIGNMLSAFKAKYGDE